jgi:hypothetical protein
MNFRFINHYSRQRDLFKVLETQPTNRTYGKRERYRKGNKIFITERNSERVKG